MLKNSLHQELLIKAQHSFNVWKNFPFEKKQLLLKELSKILLEKQREYSELITSEMHKPISQSLAEVQKSALMIDFYASIENPLGIEKIETDFSISEVHQVPMGVILGIMPWNFPFWQALRFAIPTLLAGNTILLKHASNCLGSGNALEKLLTSAGFPEGVFQHIKADYDEIEDLIAHPFTKGISLTGSESAGRKIASIAGKHIKKTVLELGGNDAFIILEDADIQQASKQAVQSRLQNCGQTCIAAKRWILHEKIADEFIQSALQEIQKYTIEDPWEEKTIYSKMAKKELADELEKQYQKALEHGATIIQPLERVDENSFHAGILKMNKENPIRDEEFFGPLGMVFIGKDEEELLKIANDTQYGLGNSVWTKSMEKAQFFIDHLESGTVSINQLTKSDPRLPFGGTKNSGYGIELSLDALKEFTNKKTIVGNI